MLRVLSFLLLILPIGLFAQSPQANFQLNKRSGCIPLQVQFTNQSSNATHYKWLFGDGSSSTQTSPTKTYVNINSYHVSLIAFNQNGESDTLTLSNAIHVRNQPQVHFTWTLQDSCESSNQIQFQNHSHGGQLFVWDFGDGQQSTAANPIHRYQAAGNYLVSLLHIDTLGCAATTTANKQITIYSKPHVLLQASKYAQCDSSDRIYLSAQANQINQYVWNFGNGQTSTLANPSIQYADTGQYEVTLLTQNQFGCISKDTLNQLVRFQPSKRPSFQLNDTLSCSPFHLQASAELLPYTTYQWLLNGIVVREANDFDTLLYQANDYRLELISKTHNSCPDTQLLSSNIKVLPKADASFQVDSINQCVNGLLNVYPKANAVSYFWNFGDGQTANQPQAQHRYDSVGIFQLSLIVENTFQCRDTNSRNIHISAFKGSIKASPTRGCMPLSVQFSDSSKQATKWKWIFDDGDTSLLQHPQHTYVSSGKFNPKAILSTANGCQDTVSIKSGIHVSADSLDLQGDTIYSCAPTPIDYQQLNLGNTFWIWHFGNGDSSLLKNPVYSYKTPGTYTLSLETENELGCPTLYQNIVTYVIGEVNPNPQINYFDCTLKMVGFTDSTANAASWYWDFGDGNSSNLQSPGHIFSSADLFHISLTVTTIEGCVQTVLFPNLIDLRNCHISGGFPIDTANMNSSSSGMNFTYNSSGVGSTDCAPKRVQFSAPSDSALSYAWQFGDGTGSNQQNPFHTYYQNGTFDVQLIEFYLNYTDTTLYPSLIHVNGPSAQIQSQFSYDCDKIESVFYPIQANEHWYWTYANQDSLVLDSFKKDFYYHDKIHTLILHAIDSNNCSAVNVSTFNFPKSPIKVQYTDSSCLGAPLSFQAIDTSRTFTWYMGDGTILQNKHKFDYSYQFAGKYQVKLIGIDSIGCTDTLYLDSIKVKGSLATFNLQNDTLCKNELIQAVPHDLTADTYQWFFNDSLFSSQQNLNQAPLNNGMGLLKLQTTKDGCSNHFSDSTVFIKSVESNFLVRQLNACFPLQIALEDTNQNTVSSKWFINNQFIGNSKQINHLVNKGELLQIKLTNTHLNACVDSTLKTFKPNVLSADFYASDTLACRQNSIQFYSTSILADSLSWDFGNGQSSTLKNPVVKYDSSGVFTVSLKVFHANGCSDTMVKYNYIQIEKIEAKFTAQFSPTCAPMMVYFNNQSKNATNYHWDFGNGKSSLLENPTHTYINSGYFSPRLIAQNGGSCRDTFLLNNYVQVLGPITKFEVSDTLLCDEQTVYFQDSSINAVDWQWDFGDGNTSSLQNPIHTYQDTGAYEVLLITTDASGCSGFYQYPQKIRIDYKPQASFILSDSIGCSPFLIEPKNHSTAAVSFKWQLNDQSIDTLKNIQYSIPDSGEYQVSLTAVSKYGCQNNTSKSIKVNHTPNASLFGPDEVCFNQTPVEFTVAEEGGCWHGKGFKTNGHLHAIKNRSYLDTLVYHFTGKCPSSDTLLVKVNASPDVNFQATQKEACKKLTTTLRANIKVGSDSSGIQFKWFANQQLIGQQKEFKYTFYPGSYDITLITSLPNQCEDTVLKKAFIQVHDSLPYRLDIKNVDYLNQNQLIINWHSIDDPSFQELWVYRKQDNEAEFQKIATIHNIEANFFLDNNIEANKHSYCYKVVAIDRCQQQFALEDIQEHCSILLKTRVENKNTVQLNWNAYVGSNVEAYAIYRHDHSSNESIYLADVSWQNLSFYDSTAYCSAHYSYQIRAKLSSHENLVSKSNIQAEELKGLLYAEEVEILKTTIVNNEYISLEWSDQHLIHPEVIGYTIYRKKEGLPSYQFVEKTTLGKHQFNDYLVNVQEENYSYKVGLASSCKTDGQPQNFSSPILLKGIQHSEKAGRLKWSAYEIEKKKIDHYEVQRKNEFGRWEKVKEVSSKKNSTNIDF